MSARALALITEQYSVWLSPSLVLWEDVGVSVAEATVHRHTWATIPPSQGLVLLGWVPRCKTTDSDKCMLSFLRIELGLA